MKRSVKISVRPAVETGKPKKSKAVAQYEHPNKPKPDRCGNCRSFEPDELDCVKVNRNTPGPDMGVIDFGGWCRLGHNMITDKPFSHTDKIKEKD